MTAKLRTAISILLAAVLVSVVGCATGSQPDQASNNLRMRSAQTSEQIDNVNYLIHVFYKQYREAKRTNSDREQIRNLEIAISKLSSIKSHLEAERSRMGREISQR